MTDDRGPALVARFVAGLGSLCALALAWAALDDITTDRTATTFAFEYTCLVLVAAWFAAMSANLLRQRHALFGAGSLLVLALMIALVWTMPPQGQPFNPALRALGLGGFAWFLAVSGWLCFSGLIRSVRERRAS